jgi:RNA polymerase sigma factor (TIGR02999 family)
MSRASPEQITHLLRAWRDGDPAALERLAPLVEAELHRLARRYMRRERAGHTLQTTALVNEAFLRLADAGGVPWQDRAHSFAVAAQAMRRVLVDAAQARRNLKRGGGARRNLKRGGGARRVTLEDAVAVAPERGADVLALDEALGRLARLNARQARVVELRYFGGLTEAEVAEVLGVSERTVRHDWGVARGWLYRALRDARQGAAMTPERWERIGRLHEAALRLAPRERAAYLARQCGGDDALRRAVESLLSAEAAAEAGGFLAAGAMADAGELLVSEPSASLVGARVGLG